MHVKQNVFLNTMFILLDNIVIILEYSCSAPLSNFTLKIVS